MNILVSNDDGINAKGIHELVEELHKYADVYVSAPDGQRSASGHGITMSRGIEAIEASFENAKKAYAVTGSPADSVKLGVYLLEKEGINIDIVFTGINHGGNLGTDTHYSGTVSAAMEGLICGKPSFAVSVDNHNPVHLKPAAKLAAEILRKTGALLDNKTVLNINLPDLPQEELKEPVVTILGTREYTEDFVKYEKEGKILYRYGGTPAISKDLPDNADVIAVQNGHPSITPLHGDFTNYRLLQQVKDWLSDEKQ